MKTKKDGEPKLVVFNYYLLFPCRLVYCLIVNSFLSIT